VYRDEIWRELAFTSRDGFVQGFLQAYFLPMDPNNLLCQAAKWRSSDVSASTGGDMDAALARITAATTLVGFTGDLFLPPGGRQGRRGPDPRCEVPRDRHRLGPLHHVQPARAGHRRHRRHLRRRAGQLTG
jgi:homoserine acetyltransferase